MTLAQLQRAWNTIVDSFPLSIALRRRIRTSLYGLPASHAIQPHSYQAARCYRADPRLATLRVSWFAECSRIAPASPRHSRVRQTLGTAGYRRPDFVRRPAETRRIEQQVPATLQVLCRPHTLAPAEARS